MQGLLMIDMQKAFDNSSWGERNNPQLEVNSQKLLNFFREKGWPVLHVNTYLRILNHVFTYLKVKILKMAFNHAQVNLFSKR